GKVEQDLSDEGFSGWRKTEASATGWDRRRRLAIEGCSTRPPPRRPRPPPSAHRELRRSARESPTRPPPAGRRETQATGADEPSRSWRRAPVPRTTERSRPAPLRLRRRRRSRLLRG